MTNGTPGTRETPQTLTGGSALDAAIEAAARALYGNDSVWPDLGPGYQSRPLRQAEAAVRAAEPILRQAVAEEIAYRIRAELVCCRVYHDTDYLREEGEASSELLDAIIRDESICYWGEAAALLAEDAREVGRRG